MKDLKNQEALNDIKTLSEIESSYIYGGMVRQEFLSRIEKLLAKYDYAMEENVCENDMTKIMFISKFKQHILKYGDSKQLSSLDLSQVLTENPDCDLFISVQNINPNDSNDLALCHHLIYSDISIEEVRGKKNLYFNVKL